MCVCWALKHAHANFDYVEWVRVCVELACSSVCFISCRINLQKEAKHLDRKTTKAKTIRVVYYMRQILDTIKNKWPTWRARERNTRRLLLLYRLIQFQNSSYDIHTTKPPPLCGRQLDTQLEKKYSQMRESRTERKKYWNLHRKPTTTHNNTFIFEYKYTHSAQMTNEWNHNESATSVDPSVSRTA